MGYSADSVEMSGPIVIKADRVVAFFEHVIALPSNWVSNGGPGRWSWTQNFVDYEQTPDGLLKLLVDYGFMGDTTEDNDVELWCWGGDKLGATEEQVWETLATFADGDVRWVFVGEDGDMWADCIESGRHVRRGVRILVEE